MACHYISMLMTATYTAPAPVSQMLLHHCRTQCRSVSIASLTGCARIASNSMPIRRRWCGARPLVSCCNYPAVRCLLLVHSLVLTTPFVTWVYLLTTTSVRLLTFGELCHAVSRHSASFVTFVDTSPTTVSVPWWCRLCTQDLTTATLSDIAYKTLRSCLGRHCNSTLASSTTMSQLLRGRHGISCAAWFHSTMPEWSTLWEIKNVPCCFCNNLINLRSSRLIFAGS